MSEDDIQEMPQPIGIFAGELYSRSIQYIKACETLNKTDSRIELPAYFLLAHSLELLLKGYLASKGVKKLKIRGYNHRVIDLYRDCNLGGLITDQQVSDLVEQVAIMNKDHDFRYPSGYQISMPPMPECLKIMEKIISIIGPIIQIDASSADLDFASATRHLRGKKIRWSD